MGSRSAFAGITATRSARGVVHQRWASGVEWVVSGSPDFAFSGFMFREEGFTMFSTSRYEK